MSSCSEERLSFPDKGLSLSSPSDLCCSASERDEESRSTHHEEEEEEGGSGRGSAPLVPCLVHCNDQERNVDKADDEYFRPIKKLRMVDVRPNIAPNPQKPLTSFFIKDILSHKPSASRRNSAVGERGIVRPWDFGAAPCHTSAAGSRRRPRSADDDSRSEKSDVSDSSESPAGVALNASPLDALFEMTSKAFEGLDADEKATDATRDHLNLFSSRQQPKKKRKSRTAFTNHQIFELEKRFLYQKYLSPADRDEIAQSLGLTNAQVITWFQNRRAKLKRDMEELKKDVDATKVRSPHSTRPLMDSIQDMSVTKRDSEKSIDC